MNGSPTPPEINEAGKPLFPVVVLPSPFEASFLEAVKKSQGALHEHLRLQREADEHLCALLGPIPPLCNTDPVPTGAEMPFFGQYKPSDIIPWAVLAEELFGSAYRGIAKRTSRFLKVIKGRGDCGITAKNGATVVLPYELALHASRLYNECLKANKRERGRKGKAKLTQHNRKKNFTRK